MSIQIAASTVNATLPVLPVAHLTGFDQFESMVRNGAIDLTSTCPRLGRPACYFFYGAPYYKLRHAADHELSIEEAENLPVGLLLDSSVLDGLNAEVFPFDTGAMLRGAYRPHLAEDKGALAELGVPTSNPVDICARLVTLLFGSNRAYVLGDKSTHPATATPGNACVELVKRLHAAPLKADIRRRAIEVVALHKVPLLTSRLLIIAPDRYWRERVANSKELQTLVESPLISVKNYTELYPYSPTSDSRVVLNSAVEWLLDNRLL